MRQLIIKVPKGNKEKVLSAIDALNGKNTIDISNQEHDVFMVFLPNRSVNDFLGLIEDMDPIEINLIPRGVINLYPPQSEAPAQVADVQPNSSLEIYLGGIQSVGSKFGLIGYSFAAGVIVWIGLYTNTSYLLVAAMLIAPFAGPAMNAALATAAGKTPLLYSSLSRYGLAIGTGIVASLLLTLIFKIETLTPLMIEISQVSKTALLLPLISGFAGAINICQSERDSLVSGAAVGILVAASLAPPVGLIGVGLYLMEWNIVFSSLFRIILQLFGIHLTATLVFYFFGNVTPHGIRFLKGNMKVVIATCTMVLLGIGALMFWQFSKSPFLRKASMKTELTEAMGKELSKLSYIKILNKDVSFTNTELQGKRIAKFHTTVYPFDTIISDQSLKNTIVAHLEQNLNFQDRNVHSVYQVDVVQK